MNKKELLEKLLKTNLLSLAFLGDSIHTAFVRKCVLEKDGKMTNYHAAAAKFCRASHQAKVMAEILPLLTADELDIVRRARNAKPKHTAKNASHADYTEATMFEALIGFLYLKDDTQRLEQFLKLSVLD